MKKLTIKQERLGPIFGGHPWIFSGAIRQLPEGLIIGEPVEILTDRGDFLASGYFNSYSQLAVRLWSYQADEKIDQTFFATRIKQAQTLRTQYLDLTKTNAFRLVNSESDFLPGLIVDQYDKYLVVQFHTKGIEAWRELIIKALIKTIKPQGIYERSDVANRKWEDLGEINQLLFGEIPEEVEIKENGFKFLVDLKGGQKTGFFLDQRDKRLALMKYCQNKTVLNACSYTGGFSVYALAGGAKRVVNVDASQTALAIAKKNLVLNKFKVNSADFVTIDIKKYLTEVNQGNFDLIILDPPAFIKDHHKKAEGLKGYRHLNETAMRLLPNEGILVSCSCSAHVNLEEWRFLLTDSAARAGVSLQILEVFTHGLDHQQLSAFIEGEYLKVVIGRVIKR